MCMVIVFDRQRKAVFRFDFQNYRGGGIWTRSVWIGFLCGAARFIPSYVMAGNCIMGRRLMVRRLQDVYFIKIRIVGK